MKMLKPTTILAATGALLLAASAGAHMPSTAKDVVKSSNGRVVLNSFNNCVLTKWDATHNECNAAAVAGSNLELRTVYFDFDSSALTPAAKAKLDVLAASLRNDSADAVRIVGYADEIGTTGYNSRLSQRRANSVARYLRSRGLKVSGNYEVRGLGETSSQSNCAGITSRNEKIACLWRDRRVEVEVVN